jgi:hypothetical protein
VISWGDRISKRRSNTKVQFIDWIGRRKTEDISMTPSGLDPGNERIRQ